MRSNSDREVGVVVIGRNEGERLVRGLHSMVGDGRTLVYVDSGSTDQSVASARALGTEVVELDLSRPFTAARARNAGFERLQALRPDLSYVQFVDGDCEIEPGWFDHGLATIEAHPRAAVVFGLLRERHPERSIYNRMAQIEWNVPIGRSTPSGQVQVVDSGGGNALIRAEAFAAVGGFDPAVPVCEEPELCQRLRHAGWSILRVETPMAIHDAALLRFAPWARRTCRTGYGALDFTVRFGGRGDNPFARQVRSARIWGLGWPLVLLVATTTAGLLGGRWAALIAAALVIAILPLQVLSIAWRNRHRAGGLPTALAYGVFTLASKWLQLAGQWLYLRDRRRGETPRLIEHKAQA